MGISYYAHDFFKSNNFYYLNNIEFVIKAKYFYPLCAMLLTVGLFLVGGRPGAGSLFKGNIHWLAHFLTYTLLAIFYVKALPKQHALIIAAIVACVGGLHEAYEIKTHGHAFEYEDFLINSFGAFCGVLLCKLSLLKFRRNSSNP